MNYSRNNAIKQYNLRKRKPLETIQESDASGSINKCMSDTEDAFDKLLKSPLKQTVTLKPLSHWAKKVAELEKSGVHSKKAKDLYEMSSPDDASPYKKVKKKPKPRKRKENFNFFDGLLAKTSKSSKPKKEFTQNIKKDNMIKAPKNIMAVAKVTMNTFTSTNHLPIFGLTSTPDKNKKNSLLEPSFYNFCSPIVTEKTMRDNSSKVIKNFKSIIDHTPIITVPDKLHTTQYITENIEKINETNLSNSIVQEELIENGFSGFSSFAEDPNNTNARIRASALLENRNSHFDKSSLSENKKRLSNESSSLKDKNVTLRRKCKRSSKSYSVNPELVSGGHSEDSKQHITLRRPNYCKNKQKLQITDYLKKTPAVALDLGNVETVVQSKITRNSVQRSMTVDNNVSYGNILKENACKRNLCELKTLTDKTSRKHRSNSEVSPYFPTEAKSSSESSFILDTPPKKNSILNNYTINDDVSKCQKVNKSIKNVDTTLNKTLLCLNSTLIKIKGGKQHNRARAVIRQLQTGRLTLHNTTLLPQVPVGRGRGFESFVGGLLELQPGIDETLLNETKLSGPLMRSTIAKHNNTLVYTNTNVRKSPNSHQSIMQTSKFFEKGNKTVHFEESPISRWRSTIRGQRRVSRLEKPVNASNLSLKSPLIEQHDVSNFRAVFGLHESSDDSAAEKTDNKLSPWTARDAILSRCNQTDPLNFSEHFNESTLPECKKIGEGVYGEVFMYSSKLGTTVFKVIPIEGDLLVNDEPQKTFTEILSEIVISMELSNLRDGKEQQSCGYAELRRTWCVQGEYPDFLVDLWNDYDLRKGSENDNPTMFSEQQLYIVLELGHGGLDLEAFVFHNAAQALSAFRQAAFSLAVAEKALEFEHRDFHWGNVLVSETSDDFVTFALDGKQFQIPCAGVKVTIIDFTLSRITFEDCSVFNDLSVDPTLFTSEGDYQFEIYRMMRDETKNNWEQFTPRTNVFWLHYILDKMLSLVRYSRPKSKTHSTAVQRLRNFKKIALQFPDSAQLAVYTLN